MNEKFLKYLKPLWKHFFLTQINVLTNSSVQTKSQSSCYLNNNFTMLQKVFEDHIEFKKAQVKTQNIEIQKLVF